MKTMAFVFVCALIVAGASGTAQAQGGSSKPVCKATHWIDKDFATYNVKTIAILDAAEIDRVRNKKPGLSEFTDALDVGDTLRQNGYSPVILKSKNEKCDQAEATLKITGDLRQRKTQEGLVWSAKVELSLSGQKKKVIYKASGTVLSLISGRGAIAYSTDHEVDPTYQLYSKLLEYLPRGSGNPVQP